MVAAAAAAQFGRAKRRAILFSASSCLRARPNSQAAVARAESANYVAAAGKLLAFLLAARQQSAPIVGRTRSSCRHEPPPPPGCDTNLFVCATGAN